MVWYGWVALALPTNQSTSFGETCTAATVANRISPSWEEMKPSLT